MSFRLITAAVGAGLTLLAAGCAYDPYTGTYVPCCAYHPYGYYGAPAYAPPPGQAAPAAGMGRIEPEPGQPGPGPYPPGPGPNQPGPYQPGAYEPGPTSQNGHVATRFQQANVTQDGRLTLRQARADHWKFVVRNFAAIDAGGKGYVTLDDVSGWLAARRQAAAG